jgi:alkylhydroperoxidase/carboxymuconolactone decarboxylase family protein YurZ
MHHEEMLRRLAISDDGYVDALLAHDPSDVGARCLDPKTHALVRIGALITMNAAPAHYMAAVESAKEHGATLDEIVGTLIAVMPVVGTARVVTAAPKLGLAIGYDVGHALEQLDPEPELVDRLRAHDWPGQVA